MPYDPPQPNGYTSTYRTSLEFTGTSGIMVYMTLLGANDETMGDLATYEEGFQAVIDMLRADTRFKVSGATKTFESVQNITLTDPYPLPPPPEEPTP